MRQMEAAVEAATGYRAQLVHKPMDEAIEISKAGRGGPLVRHHPRLAGVKVEVSGSLSAHGRR